MEPTVISPKGSQRQREQTRLANVGFPLASPCRQNSPPPINYVMAVAAIPKGFDRVASVNKNNRQCGDCCRKRSGNGWRTPIDLTS